MASQNSMNPEPPISDNPPTVIAVDGPAASGKGTIAKRIAHHYGFAYLDTGKLYRAVGLSVLAAGGDPNDPETATLAAQQIDPSKLDDLALSSDEAGSAASKVAAIPTVRGALFAFQTRFAVNPPGGHSGAVLDGRDIGTVICPNAPAKLFVTADVETRADRRHKELISRGETSIYPRVLKGLRERDARDAGRSDAPLKPADDARLLDTSALGIEEAVAAAIALVDEQLNETGHRL